jgi:predicted RNase H-like HicB family nuclease
MTYQVLLQHLADDGYKATALAVPECIAVGKTRDEALGNLKAVLTARLAEGEILTVEVGEPEHAWLKWSGVFKDDPTFDDFLAEVEAYRQEVDEEERDRADPSP